MGEKSFSVRLVNRTVILRNSKPQVLFLISPITFSLEHIVKLNGLPVGGRGVGKGALKESLRGSVPPRHSNPDLD